MNQCVPDPGQRPTMATKTGAVGQSRFHDLQSISPASTVDEKSLESQQSCQKESQINKRLSWMKRIPGENVRDLVLGASDGFTVPFALAAGLTAFGSTKVVWISALAELIAGSLSMGIGGFLASRSDRYVLVLYSIPVITEWLYISDEYKARRQECEELLNNDPGKAREIIYEYFGVFNLQDQVRLTICDNLMASPQDTTHFLVKNHFEAVQPKQWRGVISGLTMGVSYFIGGLIPLMPYWWFPHRVYHALWTSTGLMVVILWVFGYCKTCAVRGWRGKENIRAGLWGGVLMLFAGGVAASAAAGVVRGINRKAGVQCH